jgi:hypothetical protein
MTVYAVLLPLFALAAPAPAHSSQITVTGRPWAPFISPMGEPFRARAPGEDPLGLWFRQADRNGDGALTLAEMEADADRFFATLDTNHDQDIDPVELAFYESEVAPEIQVATRTMRPAGAPATERRERQGAVSFDSLMGTRGALQGGARYGLLNIPEPVAAADTDFDRGVSLAEFRQAAARRFQLLDPAGSGVVRLAQLQALRQAAAARRPKPGADLPDERVGNGLPNGN